MKALSNIFVCDFNSSLLLQLENQILSSDRRCIHSNPRSNPEAQKCRQRFEIDVCCKLFCALLIDIGLQPVISAIPVPLRFKGIAGHYGAARLQSSPKAGLHSHAFIHSHAFSYVPVHSHTRSKKISCIITYTLLSHHVHSYLIHSHALS